MLNKSKRDLSIFSGKRLFSNKTLDHWMPNVIVCYFPPQILWDYIIIYVCKLLFGVLVASYWFAFGRESSNNLIISLALCEYQMRSRPYRIYQNTALWVAILNYACFVSCYPEQCLTNMRNMTKGFYSFPCRVLLHRMLVV